MLHHIIVKFNNTVEDKHLVISKASELFERLRSLDGINDVNLYPNCIDRDNRYDLMIVIDMDKKALETYDSCEVHKTWKADFGKYILSKAIFDRE